MEDVFVHVELLNFIFILFPFFFNEESVPETFSLKKVRNTLRRVLRVTEELVKIWDERSS